jgi:Ca2+-binding RTX toxin-like protein
VPITNGPDTIYGSFDHDRISALDGDDFVLGLYGGNDEIYGDNGNDTIHGDSGDDSLYGGNGHDFVRGWGGNDLVVGGAGNDELLGEGGQDILNGGSGDDTLTGGADRDLFVFSTSSQANGDHIADLHRTIDKVDISDIDADTTREGNQSFDVVQGGFVAPGQINYYKDPHDRDAPLVVRFNTDSDPQAEFAITLGGLSYVTDSDFHL